MVFANVVDAWEYLITTKVFWCEGMDPGTEFWGNAFMQSLDIDVVLVNPETGEIDDDEMKNTKPEVWFECGEPYFDERTRRIQTYHNVHFDCGGDTFENAVITLANIVHEYEESPEYKDQVAQTAKAAEVVIRAQEEHCITGQCSGCAFVAARCAEDGMQGCPYFVPTEETDETV